MRQPPVASGLARFSALLNAPGCECAALPGYGKKPCPPHACTGETANVPRQCSSCSTVALSHEVVGPGRSHARLSPKWGASPFDSILSPSSDGVCQWSSGLPGFGGTASASGEVYVHLSPLILEPTLCSQLPTPPWWRLPFNHPPTLPPARLWHALHRVYHMCARACPVCDMGACVVSWVCVWVEGGFVCG